MVAMIRVATLLICLASPWPILAGEPMVVDLWPGKPPGDTGIAGAEKFFEAPPRKTEPDKPYRVAGRPCKLLTNVTRPTLVVYRPEKDRDTGATMLICPGGGYHNLFWDLHGEEIADWLTGIGVTGIILKYRCPRRDGEDKTEPAPGPLKDAQRAVSLVRSKASAWGLDPGRIGMIGFSAGGHLVAATATSFDQRAYEPLDDVDRVSCRPDFGIMLYSGYLKAKDHDGLRPELRVSAQTPPIFLVHATDDPVSEVEHSVVMYQALHRAGVPVEMHLYATGGHPFGVRKRGLPVDAWPQRCEAWMSSRGLLRAR
jgi:acetyl esterase/lipase